MSAVWQYLNFKEQKSARAVALALLSLAVAKRGHTVTSHAPAWARADHSFCDRHASISDVAEVQPINRLEV